jgi:hypothetical protein
MAANASSKDEIINQLVRGIMDVAIAGNVDWDDLPLSSKRLFKQIASAHTRWALRTGREPVSTPLPSRISMRRRRRSSTRKGFRH